MWNIKLRLSSKLPGPAARFLDGVAGKPSTWIFFLATKSSRDGIGSAKRPRHFISEATHGLAIIGELYNDEPFSHTMLSKSCSWNLGAFSILLGGSLHVSQSSQLFCSNQMRLDQYSQEQLETSWCLSYVSPILAPLNMPSLDDRGNLAVAGGDCLEALLGFLALSR